MSSVSKTNGAMPPTASGAWNRISLVCEPRRTDLYPLGAVRLAHGHVEHQLEAEDIGVEALGPLLVGYVDGHEVDC